MKTVPVYDFRGRIVLVTGATRNLGFTIAVEFARAGARVILHGPSREESREATRRLGEILSSADAHEAAFDLGNPAEIETAFSDLSQRGLVPDILVNNAAHLGLGESGFLAQTPEFFRSVLEVNLFGAFRCSQLAATMMKAKRAGAIIFISSLAGERVIWGRSAYNVSKAALDGLMRSMSVELASDGIRVNAIAPGYVWTPRWESISEEVESRRHRNIPATAPTQQDEIANAVLFLASDAAPTLVGTRLVLDGGLDVQQVPRDMAV